MEKEISTVNSTYSEIRDILEGARHRIYSKINREMVLAYWNIGKIIVENEQKGKNKAEYGEHLIQDLSKRLTKDYGKGFDDANLRNMRQFYIMFKKRYALRSELAWTHYRTIMRIENKNTNISCTRNRMHYRRFKIIHHYCGRFLLIQCMYY